MSTITLKNDTVVKGKSKNTLKDRIVNYFMENQRTFILGMYVISGRMPSVEVLRAMKLL